jgi:hypothetical protein
MMMSGTPDQPVLFFQVDSCESLPSGHSSHGFLENAPFHSMIFLAIDLIYTGVPHTFPSFPRIFWDFPAMFDWAFLFRLPR